MVSRSFVTSEAKKGATSLSIELNKAATFIEEISYLTASKAVFLMLMR